MDNDIKRWSILLDIDRFEHLIVESNDRIMENTRRRNEYQIRLNQLRENLKALQ